MDSLTLRAVTAELVPYRGLRLDAVTAADPWELHLEFEKGVVLVACVHPEHNALYPAPADRVESGAAPLAFARAVEKALEGSRFAGARQAGLDRAVALAFDRRDRLGDTRRLQLVVELTGKGGNFILVEGETAFAGRILDRLREDHSRRAPRRLVSGAAYEVPAGGKRDLSTASAEELARALEIASGPATGRDLVRAWTGLSPASAEEVLRLAGPGADPAALARAWLDFAASVRPAAGAETAGAAFRPTLIKNADGSGRATCFAPQGADEPAATRTSYPAASAAVSAAHRLFRQRQISPQGALHRPVRLALDRTLRALATLDREEEEAREAPHWRRLGETILASAHRITRGVTEAELTDPRTGETLTAELDPTLGPGENAEQYFKRAKKAERGGAKLDRRRRELLRRREALDELATELNESGAAGPDPPWYERALNLGVKVPRDEIPDAADSPADDGLTSALRPRRYDLGGGWEALVGKSNRGNEVLTHEIARPHEIWMHADQASGSHLVLHHDEKGKEPPREVLLAAAAIAAFFSKARGAGKVPVLITEKRHVRRPRKAPLGTVTVGRHKTVMVAPSDPDKRSQP
jgi:predicted ribosome quality control (RQC) complex YloA/Tae2 family protein